MKRSPPPLLPLAGEYRGVDVHAQSSMLYFCDYANGVVYRTSTAGVSLTPVVSDVAKPLAVAVYPTGASGAWLFVLSEEEHAIYRADVDGEGLVVWKSMNGLCAVAAVPSLGYVYFAARGTLYRAPVDAPGTPEQVVSGFQQLVDIKVKPNATDDGSTVIILVDQDDETIYAIEDGDSAADAITVVSTRRDSISTPRGVCLRDK